MLVRRPASNREAWNIYARSKSGAYTSGPTPSNSLFPTDAHSRYETEDAKLGRRLLVAILPPKMTRWGKRLPVDATARSGGAYRYREGTFVAQSRAESVTSRI